MPNIVKFIIIAIKSIKNAQNFVVSSSKKKIVTACIINTVTHMSPIFFMIISQLKPLLYMRVARKDRYQSGTHESHTAKADHSTP